LIIGATSSVAADVARIWAKSGHSLVLVARSESKLAALQAELGDAVLGTRSFDFTQHEAIGSAVEELHEEHGAFEVALVAHGYLGDQLKSESEFAETFEQVNVNFLSAVAWLIPLANRMEAENRGQLAVITSVAGDRGRPRNYTYGASKGALTLYLQGLRSRLYPAIAVTTIKLGPVDTPMTVDHPKNASFITSEQAAEGIARAIERRRAEVYVPGFWRPIMWAVRSMPEAVFQRLKFLSGR
jgi:short-subunit dehydrogenase